jgi:NitT/TauT family transport system ATP-binding protein/nitrate/nitrite transport system substrate-binding protein
VRLGLLRLTDSAPAVLAETEGLFAANGLEVTLQVEPSWANLADKLCWDKLDAAIMLPPLVLAVAAGLRGPPRDLVVPMGISQGGNTVVIRSSIEATPADFPAWLRDQPRPPRFAVVHLFSTHNLLLRHWLAAAGIDPDRDLDIVVIPPERVVAELVAGHIAGFCAGAPWGDVAEMTGAGRILLGSSTIRPHHAEKCLALAAGWATEAAAVVSPLLRALHAAQLLCDQPARTPALAALLAERLDLPSAAAQAALAGGLGVERISFAAAANPADALWFLHEMRRWGWIDPATDLVRLAARVYRPHLFQQ